MHNAMKPFLQSLKFKPNVFWWRLTFKAEFWSEFHKNTAKYNIRTKNCMYSFNFNYRREFMGSTTINTMNKWIIFTRKKNPKLLPILFSGFGVDTHDSFRIFLEVRISYTCWKITFILVNTKLNILEPLDNDVN